MKPLLAALALASLASPARAQFISGNSLNERCQSPASSPAGLLCMAYITGVADAMIASGSKEACFAPAMTAGAIVQTASDFIRDSPQLSPLPAALLVNFALAKAYPCPAQTAALGTCTNEWGGPKPCEPGSVVIQQCTRFGTGCQ